MGYSGPAHLLETVRDYIHVNTETPHPSGSAILSSRSVRASCASTSASSRCRLATLSLSSCTATSAAGGMEATQSRVKAQAGNHGLSRVQDRRGKQAVRQRAKAGRPAGWPLTSHECIQGVLLLLPLGRRSGPALCCASCPASSSSSRFLLLNQLLQALPLLL